MVLAVALAIGTPAFLPAQGAVTMGSAPASASAGDIALTDGFALAMSPGQSNGGGYMTIANRGPQPDRLIALSSPSSGEVEVHETTMDDGAMRMRPLPGPLEIQPGKTVALQPRGDLHLMFVGVTEPFTEGSEVSVTLTFEKAGKIALKLPVLSATAEAANSSGVGRP